MTTMSTNTATAPMCSRTEGWADPDWWATQLDHATKSGITPPGPVDLAGRDLLRPDGYNNGDLVKPAVNWWHQERDTTAVRATGAGNDDQTSWLSARQLLHHLIIRDLSDILDTSAAATGHPSLTNRIYWQISARNSSRIRHVHQTPKNTTVPVVDAAIDLAHANVTISAPEVLAAADECFALPYPTAAAVTVANAAWQLFVAPTTTTAGHDTVAARESVRQLISILHDNDPAMIDSGFVAAYCNNRIDNSWQASPVPRPITTVTELADELAAIWA